MPITPNPLYLHLSQLGFSGLHNQQSPDPVHPKLYSFPNAPGPEGFVLPLLSVDQDHLSPSCHLAVKLMNRLHWALVQLEMLGCCSS